MGNLIEDVHEEYRAEAKEKGLFYLGIYYLGYTSHIWKKALLIGIIIFIVVQLFNKLGLSIEILRNGEQLLTIG